MQKSVSVIDLSAIRKNALKIREMLGEKFFYAVVKADGYGHGAEEVARAIEDIADGFCVAIIEEGVSLRIAGVSKPILVFTPPFNKSDVSRAQFYNLTLTVNSAETARLVGGAPCQIKVNTGMNRIGCKVAELKEILSELKEVTGVYSHLFAAEDEWESYKQLSLFSIAEELVKDKFPQAAAHLSASGGILRGGDYLKDGGRAGILLYGYAPAGFTCEGFTPAMKVYARRIQTTGFIGGGVGYGVAHKIYDELSTYRLGYADGFFRSSALGEGKLCMDSFIREGGEKWECVMADADELAQKSGTISYEILTSVSRRSKRVYIR